MERSTKQKQDILMYLKNNRDKYITATNIIDDLSISKSTVYRFLKVLEENNQIKKYYKEDISSTIYQYVGDNIECSNHYHMICTCCNDIYHVESNYITEFIEETESKTGFNIKDDITFSGTCKKCLRRNEK